MKGLQGLTALAGAVGLALLQAGPAFAQEDFYKDKTVRIIVGYGAGGGYDTYARMIAPHLGERLGATVIVENQPGAGGVRALNNIAAAEPDGTRLMIVNGTAAAMAQILEQPGVRYDLSKLSHLGTVSRSPWVWLVHQDSPLKTPADFQKSEKILTWSASGPADALDAGARVTCEVLDLKCKVVLGYKGSNDAALAVTRKEVDAIYISDTSGNNYVKSNDLRAVANMSRKRSRFFPDTQTVFEAAKLSADGEWLLDFHGAVEDLGRILVAPANLPKERLERLQKAVRETLTDKDFVAEGEKTQRYIDFADAEATAKAARQVTVEVTPEQRKRVLKVLKGE